MDLGVTCECGRTVPVKESDAGGSVFCSCTAPIVVPPLEEFRGKPVVLSAANAERRVWRLVTAGELPPTGTCQRCGEAGAQRVVDGELECESASYHASGGLKGLILPIAPWAFVWMAWEEESRVEVRGRDTRVPAPISLCPGCHRQLTRSSAKGPAIAAALVLVAGALVACLGYLLGSTLVCVSGCCLAGIAPLQFYFLARLAVGRQQRRCKDVLRTMQPYAAVLRRYPYAVIRFSREPSDGAGRGASSPRQDASHSEE
jgi:hypothetical protein